MTNVKEHMQKEHESPLARSRARLFRLVRDEDETGVSGTGVVAEGVEFSNGTCALSWLTPMHSVGVYPGMRQLEAIHGHDGRTRVEYVESPLEYSLKRALSTLQGELSALIPSDDD